MNVVLAVENLRKVYASHNGRPCFEAVKGIDLQISEGECVGLLGPNGAGKTTSMRCITGFYPPTEGSVKIQGVDVHAEPKKARQQLGVCAQDDTLDTEFNMQDQLIQFATFFGIPRQEGARRAEELLQRFGIYEKRFELVEALSGGMRRRLQVARSLINQPRLLVLDEPTTGLDPEARRVLWDILAEERKCGLAILLSTHYMEEAERLCDRVAIMHRGEILACDVPQRLIEQEIGHKSIAEEVRPGFVAERAPNLEDVYLKLAGTNLSREGGGEE